LEAAEEVDCESEEDSHGKKITYIISSAVSNPRFIRRLP
jgi:hypothetical protein